MRYPPILSFRGKSLGLELDLVFAGYLWPDVKSRCLLLIRVTELEDDFGIADGKAIHVGDTPAQDERVVVEPEVGRVTEDDLPDLWP